MFYEHIIKKSDELIPYINNSRTHSDAQVSQIAASIKEWGFTNPLLIDESGSVIAGHGRLMAAVKLGLDEVPCIVVAGLTETQRKAYVLADNQLALNAGWDFESLRLEVDSLKAIEFDLKMLGFDDNFLSDLAIDGVALEEFPTLKTGEKEPFQQVTYTLHDEQVEAVKSAITLARTNPVADTGLNDNANGNAITLICEEWLNGKI